MKTPSKEAMETAREWASEFSVSNGWLIDKLAQRIDAAADARYKRLREAAATLKAWHRRMVPSSQYSTRRLLHLWFG